MSDNSKKNGSDKDRDEEGGGGNVTKFPSDVRDRQQYYKEKQLKDNPPPEEKPPHEPMFNFPPLTKMTVVALFAVHVVFLFVPDQIKMAVYVSLGFIPARYTGGMDFDIYAVLSPLTHMGLHVGWLHLFVNSGMILVFMTILERIMDKSHVLIIFFVAGIIGAFTHFAFYPDSFGPLIGASGGVSGLFGAVIVIMGNQPGASRRQMYLLIGIWVAISVLFGTVGMGDVENIAWTAHIGGMFGGIGAFAYLRKKYYKYKE